VNEATVRVLVAEGCEVVAPVGQGCCGALALHAGRLDEARAFAKRTIETFEQAGVERVVVNAAGCGSSMKEYGQLLADDPAWAARAAAFTARVRDVTELLVELGAPRAPRARLDLRVAYHDACHLAHAQGVGSSPAISWAASRRRARAVRRAGHVLRQRRHLQPGPAGRRARSRRAQGPAPGRRGARCRRHGQSRLHAADRRVGRGARPPAARASPHRARGCIDSAGWLSGMS
jgi:hypothetical protein